MTENEKLILREAVRILYLDDDRDYSSVLWRIVEILGGKEAVKLLESNPEEAYGRYVVDAYTGALE